jgi:hypothetical protein
MAECPRCNRDQNVKSIDGDTVLLVRHYGGYFNGYCVGQTVSRDALVKWVESERAIYQGAIDGASEARARAEEEMQETCARIDRRVKIATAYLAGLEKMMAGIDTTKAE